MVTRRRLEVLRYRSPACPRHRSVEYSLECPRRRACIGPGQGWCRPAPGNRACAGKVVHLLTGQPTEVIHRCGDQVGSIACKLDNRQPGRPEPGRHSELHACKLLTMWITAVENSRIRTWEFRCGIRPGGYRGKGPQNGGNSQGTPARETLGKSEGGRALNAFNYGRMRPNCGRLRPGLRQERAKRRRRSSARRTRRSPRPGPRRGRWPAAGSAAGRGGCRQ